MLDLVPSSILRSDEWCSLSDSERDSFCRRLIGIRELGWSLESGGVFLSSESIYRQLEDLTLDVLVLQEFEGAGFGGISRWLLFYSWPFQLSGSEMVSLLPESLRIFLSEKSLFPEWMENFSNEKEMLAVIGSALVEAVRSFSDSRSFSSATASMLCCEVIFSRLAAVLLHLRLRIRPEDH